MHNLLAFLVMGVVGAASLTDADVTTYKFPGKDPTFSISFPQNWVQKDKDNSGYLEMGTPDDAIWIDVWVLEKDADDANTLTDIDKDMSSWLTDVNIERTPSGDFTSGGLKFTCYDGTGKTKEGEVQMIEADICSPDGKNQVVVCYYGDKGADATYKADLQTIFQSIKAL
jgi:hypothetical protein